MGTIIYITEEKLHMNNEYINCFIKSFKAVMESFGITAENKDVTVRKSPYPADATIVVIGVTGNLHGQAIISMKEAAACQIASTMMGGVPAKMDENTKSAVAELSNMIVGNAATLLSQQGLMIDITPPSVLTGENILISTNFTSISVPFVMDGIEGIEFSLSAKEI